MSFADSGRRERGIFFCPHLSACEVKEERGRNEVARSSRRRALCVREGEVGGGRNFFQSDPFAKGRRRRREGSENCPPSFPSRFRSAPIFAIVERKGFSSSSLFSCCEFDNELGKKESGCSPVWGGRDGSAKRLRQGFLAREGRIVML